MKTGKLIHSMSAEIKPDRLIHKESVFRRYTVPRETCRKCCLCYTKTVYTSCDGWILKKSSCYRFSSILTVPFNQAAAQFLIKRILHIEPAVFRINSSVFAFFGMCSKDSIYETNSYFVCR